MILRYIFEPKDFAGNGQFVIRQSADSPNAQPGFKSSVFYKVGYANSSTLNIMVTTLVSMTDGRTQFFDGKQELCKYLNDDIEGFRPASPDELAELILEIGHRFPK